MNRRWLIIILSAVGLFMIYEIFNNGFTLFLLFLGIGAILLRNRAPESNKDLFLLIGIGAIILSIFSSRVVLVLIVLLIIILIGQFPELYQTAREGFGKKQEASKSNEFIMVQFNEADKGTARLQRNRWIGTDDHTTNDIYSWSDINFVKVMGNTIFDLGNTILPKEQNIILIRKGFGNTRILIPEGVSISLDISVLLGELRIGEEEISLKNETFKWQSERYANNARKIKIIANVLVGEVEVVFL